MQHCRIVNTELGGSVKLDTSTCCRKRISLTINNFIMRTILYLNNTFLKLNNQLCSHRTLKCWISPACLRRVTLTPCSYLT